MVKVWQEEFQDGVNEYQAVKNQAGLKIAEIKSKQEEICEQLWPEIKVAYQEVENSILLILWLNYIKDLV